jgi:hypothetical protein
MTRPSGRRSVLKEAIAAYLETCEKKQARTRLIRAAVEEKLGRPVPQSSIRSALQDEALFLRVFAGLHRLKTPSEPPA